jgi:glycosyltransferase involved in cell wall biosynthesis
MGERNPEVALGVSVDLSVVMPVFNEKYLVEESVRRVLAVKSPIIRRLDLIAVDDGSRDGSREILRELAEKHRDRITYLEHATNRGKGAAIRTGIEHARGEVCVIHDADLEYDPGDLEKLMLPFVRERADAVFGSRFLSADYRRVLYFRHAIGNRLLTLLCNLITDLNLTDMETCYKAVRTHLLQSIPLVSDDFRIEPELTIKLAKREARIFEVPISYAGRTYAEGKKIGMRDAVLALVAMLRLCFTRNLYRDSCLGADGLSNTLVELTGVPRFNRWMADAIRPYLGDRVLEIGAGLGSLTRSFLPRHLYTASDVNTDYLEQLRWFGVGRPNFDACEVDVADANDFYDLLGRYDTVVCLNVLEHVEDDDQAVRNMRSALAGDGRLVLLVPQLPALYGTLDEAVGHVRRYTRDSLRALLEPNGFAIEEIFDFNRATLPAWWFNGQVRRKRGFAPGELRVVDRFAWLMRALEPLLPWPGVSVVAVARRKD